MRSGNIASAIAILAVVLVGGCGRNEMTAAPPPQDPGPDDTSVTCNMTLIDHPGPKGQIFLKGQTAPLWFSSARDAIAFTLLPEEPKQIMAIYVNDMGKANWDRPEPGTWIDAKITFVPRLASVNSADRWRVFGSIVSILLGGFTCRTRPA